MADTKIIVLLPSQYFMDLSPHVFIMYEDAETATASTVRYTVRLTIEVQ